MLKRGVWGGRESLTNTSSLFILLFCDSFGVVAPALIATGVPM